LVKARNKSKDPLFETWLSQLWGEKPQTARGYGAGLRRLLDLMKIDSKTLLRRAERDPKKTWIQMKEAAKAFPKRSVSITALYAGRRFLLDHDEYMMLPAAKLKIVKVKPPVYLKWDDANTIADAAALPYNMIFKIMLHVGWGIGEFLKFNTPENWTRVKAKLANESNPEYFRVDFSYRKRNNRPFFSLIPMGLLRECVALETKKGMALPMSGRGRNGAPGTLLDDKHVFSARTYIESAFRTALKRAPITDVQGTPGAHELRDVFFTRAIQVGCNESAANFVMGHMIDKLGYNKSSNDEHWVWREISKIQGPAAVTENELASRDRQIQRLTEANQDLKARLERLEAISTERIALATKREQGPPKRRK